MRACTWKTIQRPVWNWSSHSARRRYESQPLRCNGGWRGFTKDEAIRAAVDELLASSNPTRPN
ncbi:hypothetical protein ACFT7S_20025 [Streptomyces sp. NPDC057136]|uniref:hypothetical protein n=1 Tax=Streptomyces sp. NPDC057136 TaxID=3346029 RepID=UPI00362F6A14